MKKVDSAKTLKDFQRQIALVLHDLDRFGKGSETKDLILTCLLSSFLARLGRWTKHVLKLKANIKLKDRQVEIENCGNQLLWLHSQRVQIYDKMPLLSASDVSGKSRRLESEELFGKLERSLARLLESRQEVCLEGIALTSGVLSKTLEESRKLLIQQMERSKDSSSSVAKTVPSHQLNRRMPAAVTTATSSRPPIAPMRGVKVTEQPLTSKSGSVSRRLPILQTSSLTNVNTSGQKGSLPAKTPQLHSASRGKQPAKKLKTLPTVVENN